MDWIAFGQKLKERRVSLGMSQDDVAKSAEISQQMVGFVERAARTNPSPEMLQSIACALGMQIEIVLSDIGSTKLTTDDRQILDAVEQTLRRLQEPERRIALKQIRRWLEDFNP